MKKRCAAIILLLCTLVTVLAGCSERQIYDYDNYADFIKLGNYKGITINQSEINEGIEDEWNSTLSSDTEAKEEIEEKTYDTPGDTDVLVQRNDTVKIDYVGKIDGVAFEGGSATDYSLTIGSDTFIDGFEDGLIDFAVGDEVALELTFPEDYHNENYAGKDVIFTVTIKSITRTVYPEMNDENVEKYTDFKTVEEYTDSIKEDIIDSLIWDELMEICKIKKYPEYEFKQYYNSYCDTYTEMATLYGGSGDTMYSVFGYSTAKAFFEAMADQSQAAVKQELIILAILQDEPSIKLSDEDFEAKVKELYDEAVENGEFDEPYDHFKEHYDEMTLKISVYNDVIIDYIDENKAIFDDITKNGFDSTTFGTRYYINGEFQKGWTEIENDEGVKELYYFDEETGYAPDPCTFIKHRDADKEMWHQFDNKGKYIGLYNNSYIDENGTRYFEEGVLVTGWKELDLIEDENNETEKYYFDDTTGYMYLGYNEVKSEGKWHKFDEKTGVWVELAGDGLKTDANGTLYFKDSVLQTGWQEINLDDDEELEKCYFNPVNKGYMVVKDVCEIEEVWTEFDENGVLVGTANGLFKDSVGTRYFVSGILQTGEQTVTEEDETNSYYFDPDNKGYCLVKAWQIDDKDTEDESDDVKVYYYDSDGHKVVGMELSIDGTTYVFDADGKWTVKTADEE